MGHKSARSAVTASGVNGGADSGLPGSDGKSCCANRSELIPLKFTARKPLEIAGRAAALDVSEKTVDYFDTFRYSANITKQGE